MAEHRTTDAAVIGGGVIGLATAYALAKEGLSVAVLERGLCGREASWAGAGVLQCGSWHRKDPLVRLQRDSLKRYPAFAAELHDRTGIDPQFMQSGSFEVLLDDQQRRMAASEVEAAKAYAEAFGETVLELLTPDEARRRESELTDDLLGVKSCPVTCQVRNPLLMQALRSACLLEPIWITEHCEVVELIHKGDRVRGVRTTGGDRFAEHVVLAAGSWSSLVDREVGRQVRVSPVRGQIVLLEMRRRPFEHIIERGKCYLVPRLDGRVVVGATQEPEAGFDKRTTAAGIEGLLTLARRLVPVLGEATLVRTWAGLRPGTPDNWPYIGAVPGIDGLWAATGHFRSGLTLAPITAQIVADLIVRDETEYDLARTAPGREIEEKS